MITNEKLLRLWVIGANAYMAAERQRPWAACLKQYNGALVVHQDTGNNLRFRSAEV